MTAVWTLTNQFGLGRVGHPVLAFYAVIMLLFLLLPVFVIVPISFSNQNYLMFPPPGWSLRWYHAVFNEPRWEMAAWNSLRIGIPVGLISAVLGTLSALGASRGAALWSKPLNILFLAPLMLPHIIIAIGLYPTLVDFHLINTYAAVVIGHTVIGIPLVFVTVTASLRSYPMTLDLAARTLGAGPWKAFWRVTFPMIWTGIATGAILAFASSFDELMLALFLTSAQTETLPRLIWDQLSFALTPAIAAAATLILTCSIVFLVAATVIGTWHTNRKRSSA